MFLFAAFFKRLLFMKDSACLIKIVGQSVIIQGTLKFYWETLTRLLF